MAAKNYYRGTDLTMADDTVSQRRIWDPLFSSLFGLHTDYDTKNDALTNKVTKVRTTKVPVIVLKLQTVASEEPNEPDTFEFVEEEADQDIYPVGDLL